MEVGSVIVRQQEPNRSASITSEDRPHRPLGPLDGEPGSHSFDRLHQLRVPDAFVECMQSLDPAHRIVEQLDGRRSTHGDDQFSREGHLTQIWPLVLQPQATSPIQSHSSWQTP